MLWLFEIGESIKMVKHGNIVDSVLNEFIQKLKENPSIDMQISENLQEILINNKNTNETTLKEALFDSHKDNK